MEEMPQRKANYFIRHWRGELSLAVAFWVNLILINLLGTLVSKAIGLSGVLDGTSWSVRLAVIAVALLSALLIGLWQIVGTWRCATSHAQRGGGAIAGVVKVILCINMLSLASGTFIVTQEIRFLIDGQRQQAFDVRVSDDKTVLSIDGEIGIALSDQVSALLQQYPEIETLTLNSIGGDLDEAIRLTDILAKYQAEQHPITTYVNDYCASACTIIFMSGDRRVTSNNAQLGFHQFTTYVASNYDAIQMGRLQQKIKDYFAQRGVKASFLDVMFDAAPDDMWHPDSSELLAANVVNEVQVAPQPNKRILKPD